MATVSSTGTATPTPTTSSTTSAASIAKTLGSGSGIDLTSLVGSLVDAQYAAKNARYTTQGDTLTAQISGVAKLKSGITGFSSALSALAKGGTLSTALTASDATVVRATATGSKALAGFNATLVVSQLAAGQTATTVATGLGRTSVVGTGTLHIAFGEQATPGDATTFTAGSTSFDVAITADDQTLEGIAKKITAANRGLTASVVTDANGDARLVVKGPTGAARAFEITSTTDAGGSGPGLGILDTGRQGVTSVGGTPQDAKFTLDGVPVIRSTNSIADLVDGARIDLLAAKPGVPVTISGAAQTSALTQAVNDLVATYNEMLGVIKEQTDVTTGTLASDSSARALVSSLRGLTLLDLNDGAAAGSPRTLAELGVGTNRDGTLSVDATRLAAAVAKDPAAIEAMFVTGTRASGGGLPGALAAIATQASNATTGLDAATQRYTKAQTVLTDAKTRTSSDEEAMRTRLTQQFSAMDTRVAAYKATQAFLTQQVAIWTKSND